MQVDIFTIHRQPSTTSMSYYEYYAHQAAQTGSGSVFAGPVFQRGYGLGSTFRSIFNFIRPLFKPAARFLGRQVLRTGAQIASDVAEGRNFKDSAREHGSEAGANIVNAAVTKIKQMQEGRGLKRKTLKKASQSKRRRLQRRTPDEFDI